jgi:hypothetical protein
MASDAPAITTYEQILELFRISDERFKEQMKESRERFDRDLKKSEEKVNRQMGKLGNRIGELIESMVEGGIVRLFRAQGFEFTRCSRNMEFVNKIHNVSGEVDLFLENGEYALLVEVKTHLSESDVRKHIKRLRKFRIDAHSKGDKRRLIAAVGGGVVREEVRNFALKQGMYVIQQSGDNVEVIPPEGKPKEW